MATVPDDVKRKRKINRLAGFGCLSAVLMMLCLIIFVNVMPAGPVHIIENFFELSRIRSELKVAEERWQSHQVVDYDIDLEGSAFSKCFIYYTSHATLHVRNGELITVTAPSGRTISDVADWLKTCQYDDYLTPQMFKDIEQSMNARDPSQSYLYVSFDPEYGFVISYQSGCYLESDCGVTLKFSNFQPIQSK